jgi:hypothetical protein
MKKYVPTVKEENEVQIKIKKYHQEQYNIILYSAAIERQSRNLSQITLTYGTTENPTPSIANFKSIFNDKKKDSIEIDFHVFLFVFQSDEN